jgi:hypothetical protein
MSEEMQDTTPEVEDVVDAPEGEEAEVETSDEVEEAAASESSEEPEKPKRRSRAEERINALTREKYEAQKQAEALQSQLMQIQQAISQQQAQQNLGQQMPKLSDFNYDEEAYQQAVAHWSQSQVQNYQQSIAQQQQQYQQMQKMQAEQMKLQQAVARGQEKYPDFMNKVFDPNLPPLREINPAAFEAVMDSDASVDVAYYLANNPQEVYAFASMNPVQAVKHVARLEAQFTEKPKAKAPLSKPPSKVSGNSEAVKDPNKMTTSEWMAWRESQLRSKQR